REPGGGGRPRMAERRRGAPAPHLRARAGRARGERRRRRRPPWKGWAAVARERRAVRLAPARDALAVAPAILAASEVARALATRVERVEPLVPPQGIDRAARHGPIPAPAVRSIGRYDCKSLPASGPVGSRFRCTRGVTERPKKSGTLSGS